MVRLQCLEGMKIGSLLHCLATRAYSDLYHDAESYFLSPTSLHLAATTEAYRNVLGRIHDPLILEMISVVIKTYNTSSILQNLVQERLLELQ
jgi:hypothetical protein